MCWGAGWVSPPEGKGLCLLTQPYRQANSPQMAACPGLGVLWKGWNHSLYSWENKGQVSSGGPAGEEA